MPNWKKVIVSGSDAELAALSAESYNVVPTGSGSVPNLGYAIPFVTSGSGNSSIFVDNQFKLQYYPGGGNLNIVGSFGAFDHSDGTQSFITASNIIASRHITGSGVQLLGVPVGSTETRVLVSDTGGNIKYRTDLSLQGATGAQGTTGPQGEKGTTGEKGETGISGSQGTTGTQGTDGPTGSQGATGATGAIGPQGTTGTQGTDGETGSQGTTGTQGTDGEKGATGAQGNVGSQGTTGPTGPQGDKGATGPQGTTGAQGNVGAQGATGPLGPQGVKGSGS